MRFFITFGQVHVHKINDKKLDKDSVAVFNAENEEAGRQKAFEMFERKWSNIYQENEWNNEWLSLYYPRGIINLD